MDKTKKKIEQCIKQYIQLFPEEYDAFRNSVRDKQSKLDNEWAEIDKGNHGLNRHLIDLPETLYHSIKSSLTQDEFDWFFARGEYHNNFKGMQWFMTKFPSFNITKAF